MFRSPQLKCDLSGLSVNVGENMITQLLKVRNLRVIFDQFLNFDHITAICRSTHFYLRNIGNIRNLRSYDACSTIIHALISCRLDYCILLIVFFIFLLTFELYYFNTCFYVLYIVYYHV